MNEFKIPSFSEHLNEAKSQGKRGMIFKDEADELLVYDRVYRKPGSMGRGQSNKTDKFVFMKYVDGMKLGGRGFTMTTSEVIRDFNGLEKIADSISKYEKANNGYDIAYLESWKTVQKFVTTFLSKPATMSEKYEDIEHQVTGMYNFLRTYIKEPTGKQAVNRANFVWDWDDMPGRGIFKAQIEKGTNEITQKKVDKTVKAILKIVEKIATDYDFIHYALNYSMRHFDRDETALAKAAISLSSKDIAKINLVKSGAGVYIEEIHDVKGEYSANGHFSHSSSYVGGTVSINNKKYEIDRALTSSETEVHQSYWN